MRLLLIAALVLSASACTRVHFQGIRPQSQYALPNSNVKPAKKVRGEATAVTILPFIFGSPYISPAVKDEAMEDALSKAPGSNMLINYAVYEEEFRFPPFTFLLFKTRTYVVEGTAATMDVGTKELK